MRWLAAMLLALCIAGTIGSASAADKPDTTRILLTFGGHGFEEPPFFAMFDALPGIDYTKAEMPKDAGLLKPGLQKEYDAVVMYDMVGGITSDQQQAFVELLKQGIGVVSLHHNLGAHRDWGEFTKIIGGKFVFGDVVLEGKPYKTSTWSHDELLKVHVADTAHPITQGIRDFERVNELAGKAGLSLIEDRAMPSNNRCLVWQAWSILV